MKTKIKNNIEYIMRDGIWYPNLKVREKCIELGKYGRMRLNYLKEYKKALYHSLLLDGALYEHCNIIQEQASNMKDKIIKQYLLNNYSIQQAEISANEIVNEFIIFSD